MEENNSFNPVFNEEERPLIKVIGVGGGGGNAVNYMYSQGIRKVDFVVCNTDTQALGNSPVPKKIQLGPQGNGAGNNPENGRQAAEASLDAIKEMLSDSTEMVFITAGMGGGTGTGAAPVIARAAMDMGILTVGIVSIPFAFEGRGRINQAIAGVEELRRNVDAILIISTERIKSIYGNLTLKNAFSRADNVLATAAKGIAEIITVPGYVNVDLEDVKTVMRNSGDVVMGAAVAEGPERALTAIKESLNSPLLLSTDLNGARNILLNISYGSDSEEEGGFTIDELGVITNYLQDQVTDETQIIWGATLDPNLGQCVSVTIVATGFNLEKDAIFPGRPQSAPSAAPREVPFTPPYVQPIQQQPITQYQSGATQQPVENTSTNRFNNYSAEYQQSASNQPEPQQPKREVAFVMDEKTFQDVPAYLRGRQGQPSINTDYADGFVAQGNAQLRYGNDYSSLTSVSDGENFRLDDSNEFLHKNVD